jgi:hypothetical protein
VLATDPRFGRLHAPFTLQTISNEACHGVLLLRGLCTTTPVDERLQPPLQLTPWLEGQARLATTVIEKAVIAPGAPGTVAGIGVEVSVSVDAPAAHR